MVNSFLRRMPSRRRCAELAAAWRQQRPGVLETILLLPLCCIVLAMPFAVLALPALLAPSGWIGSVVLLVSFVFWWRNATARSNAYRATRSNETICTFARSFARRSVDTCVVRAVWNEFHEWLPVRAEDHLYDDLGMDDIDLDIQWERLASRCGRTLDDHQKNPWIGRITTVRDVVRFLDAQPKLAA